MSKYAHSIKNLHIKHLYILKDGKRRYLCNRACSVTMEKIAESHDSVTCKNCIRLLKKEGAL